MKKEFLPYDLEVKLVELGFNEKTFDVHSDSITQGFKVIKKPTPRILFQQAFRWLYQELGVEKGIMPLDIESQQLLLKELIDKLSSKRLLV